MVGAVLLSLLSGAGAHAAFPGRNGEIAVSAAPAETSLDIYGVRLDGTLRPIVTSPVRSETFPAWSPDASRIAFARSLGGTNLDLFVANADGSGERQLTTTPEGPEESPSWSPDGRQIVYAAGGGLVIMDVETRLGRSLAIGAQDSAPAWSPDGELIAFARRPSTSCSSCTDIYTIRPDGTGLTQLAAVGTEVDPTWSPDGRQIAYAGDEGRCCVPADIYRMNRDGSDRTRLTFSGSPGPFFIFTEPTWSPDGERIAFVGHTNGGCGEICGEELLSMKTDGSDVTQISHDNTRDDNPDWGVAPNEPPDCSGVRASRPVLENHNRRLVWESLEGAMDPDGDPVTLMIDGVTQDEPVTSHGDRTAADAVLKGDGQLRVRAERSPRGDGRVYRIAFTVSDDHGGSCSGTVTVAVPRKKRKPAVDSAPPSYDSLAP
jgi:dipeptidyl aminopeptidase/acylaminoacyl peptidase